MFERQVMRLRTDPFRTGLFLAAVLFFCGCAPSAIPPAEAPALVEVSKGLFPEFTDDMDLDGLSSGIGQSLGYYKKLPEDRVLHFGKDEYRVSDLIRSLEFFRDFIEKRPDARSLREFIAANFRVYRSTGKDGSSRVLYTGYYEPVLEGSLHSSEKFSCPVLSLPDDLITADLSLFSDELKGKKITGRIEQNRLIPYPERREIEAGAIRENAKPLAWVHDPVDLFFLQIQGSGKINLAEGGHMNVHFHASNGRPYRSIGKHLIETGKIDRKEMSMQRIRSYLTEHPEAVSEILNQNPSYVFFKTEEQGPLGCFGFPLTPGRSIALDRRIFPPAALVYITARKPLIDEEGNIQSWTEFGRFALNQDTGGAIRGPARADIFWGNGPYARIAAGHLQHDGALCFLVLKPDASKP
ncbi:MAG: MltA domain-containing protein [Desulfobacterales bacterium]|nr:MltA domain-containing protein [Desulfobacterales bacterium]